MKIDINNFGQSQVNGEGTILNYNLAKLLARSEVP